MNGTWEDGTFVLATTKNDEITTLRQQVSEFKVSEKVLAHNVTALYETLALRDLEIVKLREALAHMAEGNVPQYDLDKYYKPLLSTPFTPDSLNEWLREQVGEPVCFHFYGSQIINWNPHCKNDTHYTPLYALKGEMK